MDYRCIRFEQHPVGVAVLRLARPDKLNAISPEMAEEMLDAVSRVAGSGARCLLLIGEGAAFSSGADLGGAAAGLPDDAGEALERLFNPLIESLFALPVPVVSAVAGAAAGAGCALALAADLVLAARSAYFLQAFVNLGLVPDSGATWMLPRAIGRARAMELMMLGERLPAEQALSWGLVNRVVEDEHLEAEALALAARLAGGPTVALGLIRRLARSAAESGLAEALAAEREAQRRAGETADFRAAVAAFLERRQPRFEGR
jgi:2-(1,2-epoxy-1,2-dihydrophenyl)acetyl-CoA isomerase